MGQITTTIQIYFKIEFNKQQTIANIFLCPATIYIGFQFENIIYIDIYTFDF